MPGGFNYTYPTNGGSFDWGKRELQILTDASNFTYLNFLVLNLTVPTGTFSQTFTGDCNTDWGPYKACKKSTTYCLNASVIVTDASGASYQASCTNFDLGFQNQIQINFTNSSPSGGMWLNVRLGKLTTADQVALLRMQNIQVNATTTFAFNQSPTLNVVAQVQVQDLATNHSVTKAV